MPLSQAEQQELSELRRIDELEKQLGSRSPAPSTFNAPSETAPASVPKKIYESSSPFVQKVMQNAEVTPERAQQLAAASLMPGAAGKFSEGAEGLIGAGKRMLGAAGQGFAAGATADMPEGTPVAPLASSERLSRGISGAAVGGTLQGGAEAVKTAPALLKSISRRASGMTPRQAEAYSNAPDEVLGMARSLEDPSKIPALQQQAADVIRESRKGLRGEGLKRAGSLRELLTGKTVPIETQNMRGISPDTDAMISSPEGSYTGWSPSTPMDANEANMLKRKLQEESNYLTATITDPTQKARAEQIGKLSSQVRSGIEQVGGPEVRTLNKEMQDRILLQEMLRKSQKNAPLAALSTESPDKLAQLAQAEQAGGKGLLEFGSKYGAAKTMANTKPDVGIIRRAEQVAGRAGLRGAKSMEKGINVASDPMTLQAILNLINYNKK